MAIVDIHVHVYPDKIAAKASASVGEFYHVTMEEPVGSVGRLREIMDASPITHALVHSVAVRPQTVTSINTFIAETIAANDQLIGFMTLHQDFLDPASEIERAMSLGLRGVKLHPDTQEVNLDDERLMRIYEICERKGLPVMLHCGDYRYDYSHPRRLKNVLHTFPNLVVDAAHFGGWSVYGLALEYLEDELHAQLRAAAGGEPSGLSPQEAAGLIELAAVCRMDIRRDMAPAKALRRLFLDFGRARGASRR
jgi:predicted TIM-barrel fold metal-dependent hydrolase